MGPRGEPGPDEGDERVEADEDRSGEQPPRAPDEPGEPHDEAERQAERDELEPELGPAAEGRRRVALGFEPVPAVPPELGESRRQLGKPDEAEPEHAEEHPGPDRPGRRLARELRPVAGVDDEDGELDEDAGDRDQARDAVVGVDPVQLGRRKERRGVDVRQVERRGHPRGRPEQVGGDGPDRGGDDDRPAPE